MKTVDLIKELNRNGIFVYLDDGKLKTRSEKGALTASLIDLIKSYKTQLLSYLNEAGKEDRPEWSFLPKLSKAPVSSEYPLSFSQKRFWLIEQIEGASSTYNMPATIKLKGKLSREALSQAYAALIRRHASFRTSFHVRDDGYPMQKVHPVEQMRFAVEEEVVDEASYQASILEHANQVFDLTTPPLFRVKLLTLDSGDHILLANTHHIISDAWSLGIVAREFNELYAKFRRSETPALPSIEYEYVDYSVWQNQCFGEEPDNTTKALIDYWVDLLADAPRRLPLPLDHIKQPNTSPETRIEKVHLCSQELKGLQRIAVQERVGLFAVLLSGVNILMAKWTGERDVVVGTVVAGRTPSNLEPIIGSFVNFLTLRAPLEDGQKAVDVVRQCGRLVKECLTHQALPFDVLVARLKPERKDKRNPLNNVSLRLQNINQGSLLMDGVSAEGVSLDSIEGTQLDLMFEAIETPDGMTLRAHYESEYFSSKTIRVLLENLKSVLSRLVVEPETTMAEISLSKDLEEQKNASAYLFPEFLVASNFTADPVSEFIRFWGKKFGQDVKVKMAPYNQVFQQLLTPASELLSVTNGCGVVLVRPDDWYNPDDGECEQFKKNSREFTEALEQAIPQMLSPLIVMVCPASRELEAHPVLSEHLSLLESALFDLSNENNRLCIISSDQLNDLYPVENVFDEFLEKEAHIPYSQEAFAAFATLVYRKYHGFNRRMHKVIILDCDNTLWRGACGELGPHGVELDSSYLDLQTLMIEQYNQGVVLCLCSKNNEEDVVAVFKKNQSMLLSLDHIVVSKINWEPKSANIQAIAKELNLGLDSFLFIDDDSVQCAEVKANCPEVTTLKLPVNYDAIPQFLRKLWVFDRPGKGNMGAERSQFYQSNIARNKVKEKSLSLSEYIGSLNIELEITLLDDNKVSRASEITLRTNQFNFSSQHYSEDELFGVMRSAHKDAWILKASDRFGDYGYVGVFLVEQVDDCLHVSDFMLSCRALGRGIEHAMVRHLGQIATEHGLSVIRFRFKPGKRNQVALAFLQSFAVSEDGEYGWFLTTESARRLENDFDKTVETINGQGGSGLAVQGMPSTFTGVFTDYGEIAESLSRVSDICRALGSTPSGFLHIGAGKRAYKAPETAVEKALCGIWEEILGQECVGIADNFFDLGGHSLLAAQMISRIRKLLNVDVSLGSVFSHQTIEALTPVVLSSRQSLRPSIQSISRSGELYTSFPQKRLWLVNEIEGASAKYNVPFALKLSGDLDEKLVSKSINSIVSRHEVLRTVFVPGNEGEPVQVVKEFDSCNLIIVDITHSHASEKDDVIKRILEEEASKPFDLKNDLLLRAILIRVDEQEHILLCVIHHIAFDGWSGGIVIKEFSEFYRAFATGEKVKLPPMSLQYADYAHWQRKWVESEHYADVLDYWRVKLEGVPRLLDLPTDRPRPKIKTSRGATRTASIPEVLIKELTLLGRSLDATLFMTLLAGFKVLLHGYSGQEDIVIGTSVANRQQDTLFNLIGFFVNTLPVRSSVRSQVPAESVVREVKANCLGLYENQDLPFDKLIDEISPERDPGYDPIFQILFVLQNAPASNFNIQGVNVSPLSVEREGEGVAKFDLFISVSETNAEDNCYIEFNTDLFDVSTIDKIFSDYLTVLRAMSEDRSAIVGEITKTLSKNHERPELVFHHLGVACDNISDACTTVESLFGVKSKSETVWDEKQQSNLCMLKTHSDVRIELVQGPKTAGLRERDVALYHICYATPNLDQSIQYFLRFGASVVSPPEPAILFGGLRVAFVNTSFGLVELLETGGVDQPCNFTINSDVRPLSAAKSILESDFFSIGVSVSDSEYSTWQCKKLFFVQQDMKSAKRDAVFGVEFKVLSTSAGCGLQLLGLPAWYGGSEGGFTHFTVVVKDLVESVKRFTASGCTILHAAAPSGIYTDRLVVVMKTVLGPIALLEADVYPPTKARIAILGPQIDPDYAVNLVVSGTFTIEPVEQGLLYWSEQFNQPLKVNFSPFNQCFQELLDSGSISSRNVNGFNAFLVCFTDWLGTDECVAELERNASDFFELLSNRCRNQSTHFLVQVCPISPEQHSSADIVNACHDLETRWAAAALSIPNLTVLSSSELLRRYPIDSYWDSLGQSIASKPYSDKLYSAIATNLYRTVHVSLAPAHKVIVLDCDNTLWQGECGELGPLGVSITAPYLALQEIMVEQYQRGVVLCLCSKNNGEDVAAVFEHNPNMLLTMEHVVIAKVNWKPKSENILAISEELNLGLDSFLFIDDDRMQCAEVSNRCPEVTTLRIPESAEKIPYFLDNLWLLDKRSAGATGKQRSDFYKADQKRHQLRKSHSDLIHFIDSLALKINVQTLDESCLDRAEELCLRTNQFNLTTRRHNRESLKTLMLQPGISGWIVGVSDRFGDYGQVGLILVQALNKELIVSDLMLSCRSMGRGVEHAMMRHIGEFALALGLNVIKLQFRRSGKNEPAQHFLESIGIPMVASDVDANEFFLTLFAQNAASVQMRFDEETKYPEVIKKNDNPDADSPEIVFHRARRYPALVDIDEIHSAVENSYRKSLKNSRSSANYVKPVTDLEIKLCYVWQEILGIKAVGVNDNFFEIGGNSLNATRIMSKLNQYYGISFSLKKLFSYQTVAQLAREIQSDTQVDRQPPITRVSRNKPIPASFAQQRLWILNQIGGGGSHLNLTLGIRLTGCIQRRALDKAFVSIMDRHEILRTHFCENSEGIVVQVIQDSMIFSVEYDDLSTVDESRKAEWLEQIQVDEASAQFDLSIGPMLRAKLVKTDNEEHILLVTMHHIISDGWSTSIMVREFSALYSAYLQKNDNPLEDLQVQYADYASWQRDRLRGEFLDRQLSFWANQLADLPVVHSFPLDYARPAHQTFLGRTYSQELGAVLANSLRSLCQSSGATLFMGLHAAFSLLLARYSNETDIVIGSPIANREQVEIENLIGFFVNTLVLRSDLSGNPSFTQLLLKSKSMLLESYAHQQVPFQKVVETIEPERTLSHSPLFQIMLVLQNIETEVLTLPGLIVQSTPTKNMGSQYDLTLMVVESDHKLFLTWEYNTNLFKDETVKRLSQNFERLLNEVTHFPQFGISEFDLLGEREAYQQIDGWNATQHAFAQESCIHELFEEQVAKHPDATALVFDGDEKTYAELNGEANRLAHYLIDTNHVSADALIGICAQRSFDMIVAILGVLKAGGAYVPFDPSYPPERLAYMLADSGVTTVLTQEKLVDQLPLKRQSTILLDRIELASGFSSENIDKSSVSLSNSNLAYAIYTSGSTGKPKASLLEHRGLCNLAHAQIAAFDVTQQSRVLQFASLAFDAATYEWVMALCSGATLCLVNEETVLNPIRLNEAVKNMAVTHATLPPALLPQLDIEDWASVDHLVVAGESCPSGLAGQWALNRTFYNAYGPSEATVCSTIKRIDCTQPVPEIMPIGKPINNTQAYVLDSSMRAVPVGALGELYIGGVGLSRGYLNRPELTQEKFVKNPFSSDPSSRLFKTGDLARRLSDGDLEFRGRLDRQVKIRGFRIELGEIENTLNGLNDIYNSLVLVDETVTGEKRLIAYVATARLSTGEGAENFGVADEVSEYCRVEMEKKFPEYMLPSIIVPLSHFPLTPNGKIDRTSLPDANKYFRRKKTVELPNTPTEKLLCGIWQDLLGMEVVGVTDRFFDLGGHSLLATRLIALVNEKFDVQIPLRSLFSQSTIRGLASLVDDFIKIKKISSGEIAAEDLSDSELDHYLQFLSQD
ncbi:MAG: amino acid adenylation domain-containing protein [Cellvibrio sp.]|uniref:amino acid adenylation domain-containing protein n=1 Tax=Cellvibrio sp. TaxID=1965322 RepID=UPI002724A419|nr:amino acid adenylation domain-containing protein [Cellvibrio sp.]